MMGRSKGGGGGGGWRVRILDGGRWWGVRVTTARMLMKLRIAIPVHHAQCI